MHFKNYACPNNIKALAEDGNYIWVGTSDGLYKRNKINGQVVSFFNVDNGLVNNSVQSIAIDGQGNKWIGTIEGFCKYDEIGNNWSYFPQYNSNYIMSIAIGLSGSVWFTTGVSLLKFENNTWTEYNHNNSPLPINDGPWKLVIDSQNNIWMGTNYHGIFKLKSDNITWNHFTTVEGLISDQILSLAIDMTGKICIGTANGLSIMDNNTFTSYTTIDGMVNNYVRSLAVDGNNSLWIGTNQGISEFMLDTFITFHANPSNDVTKCILADQQNNIWFGTVDGLAKYSGFLPMPLIKISNSIIHSTVNAVTKDGQDSLWFATTGGISKFNESANTWTNFTMLQGLPTNYIFDIKIDQSGVFWIATMNGVVTFNGLSFSSPLLFSPLTHLAIDMNNHVWGTSYNGNGVYEWNGSVWIHYTTGNSGLANNNVTSLAIDQSNNKWIVLASGGISKFNGSVWTTYTTSNGLLSNTLGAVTVDTAGLVWVVSDAGLNSYNGSNWQSFPRIIYDSNSLAIDSLGNFWIGTKFSGFYKISSTGKMAHYTMLNGLSFDYTNCILVDGDYKWIGTLEGVSKVSCASLTPSFTSDTICFPPIGVTTFTNTTTNYDSTVVFQWDVDNDSIPDFVAKNIQYQFSNYGKYPVHLRAINDNCMSVTSQLAIVGSQPIVSLNPTTPNINICEGHSVNLTRIINNYDPIFTYVSVWNDSVTTGPLFTADTTGDYYVTVYNYACHANSDTIHVEDVLPYPSQQICMVTVDTANGKNVVLWEKTPNAGILYYNIYKETGAYVYQPIGNVPANHDGIFVDVNSDATIKSDRYKISVVDTCLNESELSPEHKTLHLTVSLGLNNQHNLIWENYEGFSFSKYYIYRKIQNNNFQVLDSIQSTITTYTDTANIPISVAYIIEIRKPDTCFFGGMKDQTQTSNTSVSNMEEYQIIGINENQNNFFNMNIYPNPSSENITITALFNRSENLQIGITDILGKTLFSIDEKVASGKLNKTIDLKSFSSGIYFVTLKTAEGTEVKKVVKN